DHRLDSAKLELQPLSGNGLAQQVLDKIQSSQAVFRSQQVGAVLKAMGQDEAQLNSYSGSDQTLLFNAIDKIDAQLLLDGGKDLAKAIAKTQQNFSGDTLRVWNRFSEDQRVSLDELKSVFLEEDPKMLADAMLALAERLRGRKLYGAAWTLAQLASQYPNTELRAKEMVGYLEGKRLSTEYIISDFFDHGGTSMALDLLALIPAVGFTRKISRVAWLAEKGPWLRIPLTMLAGGAIHWGSTKALKIMTGYTGDILPSSFREFAGEFAS